jgi:cytochrome c-type biogenesis protein CcmF
MGPIGRFFNGEADSDVGLEAGLTRDIWTVVNPDLTPLQRLINEGDQKFVPAIKQAEEYALRHPGAAGSAAMNQIWQYRDLAIVGIGSRYVSHPWPINFLLIVDPLVSWIWIGALIIAAGGLIALWPLPAAPARRRAAAKAPAAAPSPAREPATAAVAAVQEPA